MMTMMVIMVAKVMRMICNDNQAHEMWPDLNRIDPRSCHVRLRGLLLPLQQLQQQVKQLSDSTRWPLMPGIIT